MTDAKATEIRANEGYCLRAPVPLPLEALLDSTRRHVQASSLERVCEALGTAKDAAAGGRINVTLQACLVSVLRQFAAPGSL